MAYRKRMGRPILDDKQCSRCKKRKPKADFYGRAVKSGVCKQCQTEAQTARRVFVADYLREHPCVDCGEDHLACLEFDHRDPKEKKYTVMSMVRNNNSHEKIMTEILKCDVRCCNCHRKRTSIQLGWRHKVA